MTSLPDWMYPPREEGWFADDLDHLPEAPKHTELIDGALVFRSPQRIWHSRTACELATTAFPDPNLTWFAPADVLLVVEVTSPESEHRDRTVKLRKYSEAGIRHYWLIDQETAGRSRTSTSWTARPSPTCRQASSAASSN